MKDDTRDRAAGFRAEIRDWPAADCPRQRRDGGSDATSICRGGKGCTGASDVRRDWLHACAARGLAVPRWPTRYGGAGPGRAEEKVWYEEFGHIGAPDREAPKHPGISFLPIDMDSRRVSTRAIRPLSGASPFCATFFDAVRVTKDRVGAVNRGSDVARYLPPHEPGRLLRADIDMPAVGMTMERCKDGAEAGQGAGHASAMLKHAGTDDHDIGFYQKRARVGAEWRGDYGGHAARVAAPRGI